ncbi:MAG: FAD-dependent oxidoreductase [Thermodesulfobacteriota bacterium]
MAVKTDKTGAVLVVGGGIAGIQSSLDLAEMGYYVYLVEKSPAIGGRMAQLDKTFPTNDCSMCIISPKLNDCGGHINIEAITNAEVLEVNGEPGRMKAKVLKKARYVDLKKCTACAECAKACPIEVPNEFNMGLDNRKVTYKRYAQAYPNAYAITKLDVSPCTVTCPAHVNAHGYVSLVARGQYQEALQVIMDVLPLPGTLGRICAHPCEGECRRGQVDQAVSIRDLKRLAADNAALKAVTFPEVESRPERVAIVGAGPAGLAAAFHLVRRGYKSTIFEAAPVAGGMLRLGIPDYRLPPQVLQNEIDNILEMGVEIKYNTALGKDISLDGLFDAGYKAVFLALGAHGSRRLGVEGEDAEGIIPVTKFLREANLGQAPKLGKKIVVIGGGNVAVDAARVAVRLTRGQSQVTMIALENEVEMPAWPWEVEESLEEGVAIRHRWGPRRFLVEKGRVKGLELKSVTCVFDETGRFSPAYDESCLETVEADTIIVAIGQAPSVDGLKGQNGISFGRGGVVAADPITLATGRPGVFAGGDMHLGPKLAIDAVAEGKEAAESIDRYLKGLDLVEAREPLKIRGDEEWRPIPNDIQKKARLAMPKISLEERVGSFKELELGFDPEKAKEEAARCLACGVCCRCYQCVKACLPGAVTLETHQMKDEIVELEVGSVVLATGFDPFDPSVFPQYNYTRFPNVISAMEFERILSASGPYQGHLVRPSDHQEPKKVAWLQCVGSREINRCDRPYCSAVCCMYAIKEAVIAKEHSKSDDFQAAIFYMDMRTYGKDFEKYYNRAQEAGVRFVRSRIHTINPLPDGGLELEYVSEQGEPRQENFDLVVLSVGLEPPAAFKQVAERLSVKVTGEGFISASSFEPVATSRPGVYACGAINEPKDIPLSVMEASAAASGAASGLAEARFTRTKILEYPPERDVAAEAPRIGVFVCHCGINIGGVVNVPSVAEYAQTLPFVEYAGDNLFTCSQDTQGKIKDLIAEHKLNRVVVASCSPRTHEPMFRETLQQAGLNKYLFEMANIRDHNSWVHMTEPDKATTKARDLVRAAVAKAALLQPMRQTPMGLTKEALVVGGGVAGMSAALALAEQGYPVHLVEKSNVLGGNALKLNSTWKGEDIKSFVAGLAKKVESNRLIKVYKNSRVKSGKGFLGNFETVLSTPQGETTIQHGAAIVATGGRPVQPSEYLYGQHQRVLTSLEMDEALASKSEAVKKAKAVVFIQCVGSREPQRPYCSKICCTHSVESALRVKEMNPQAQVFILYRDVRTYGFRETLYKEARSKGVIFIRYDLENKPRVETAGDNKIKVTVTDHILGRPVEIESDVLVLASGIEPNENKEVAEAFKVQLNAEGFFLEAHMKLRPVDFATEGMFLAGLAHYPKPVDESIAQARAAAARASTILAKDSIMVGGIVAVVTPEKCAVCLTCVRTCPFGVPYIGPEGHAVIEPAICQGCGACVSECPGKAITLQHFTDEQILAKAQALVG